MWPFKRVKEDQNDEPVPTSLFGIYNEDDLRYNRVRVKGTIRGVYKALTPPHFNVNLGDIPIALYPDVRNGEEILIDLLVKKASKR